MALFALRSLSETHTLEHAEENYRVAKKVAQYRVSEKAVFVPAFPGDKYLPFAAVTRAVCRNSGLPVKGTCGKAIPVVRIRLWYDGEEFYQEIIVERAEQAELILGALAAARPDLRIDRDTKKFEIF